VAGRAANGEGTIYRRKDGRYEAAAYFLTTSGSRKRIRVYGRTRQEVHDKLIEAKARARQGVPVPDRTTKLGIYLDYWLTNLVKPSLRPTTYERYETTVRLYIKPELGKYPLPQLSVPIVQSFLNRHIETGHSVRSAQIVRTTLGAALTSAQREELVARNVARLVKLPTYESGDVHPWTVAEARRFLEAVSSEPLCAAFTLLVLCGLRRGEVLGLRWQDIDFARREIQIRQQLLRVGGALRQGPVKTQAGRRDLPLLAPVHTALLFQRQTQKAATEDNGLVFTTRTGQPVEPRNFARSFKRICHQNQIRRIKLHHLRHTTATLLKDLGVPARDAQLILGHSNISTTQQIYQHDSTETRRTALQQVEHLFFRTVGGTRCRQLLPSRRSFVEQLTTILSGSGEWTRTTDPRLMSSISGSLGDRLTAVKLVMRERTRLWLLGAVAVKLAVRTERHGSTGRLGTAP